MNAPDPIIIEVDLFCGAGGATTGAEESGVCRVVVGVNHEANAIASHAANAPHVRHLCADIRLTATVREVAAEVDRARRQWPRAKVAIWASLECTNHSRAKGGLPRDADSRTLANELYAYDEAIRPDYFFLENVEEFMCWGDLDENGRPVSRYAGRYYVQWVQGMCARGYEYGYRLMNSADFGANTSRTRYFGLFARHGLPIAFPEPTHAKPSANARLFEKQPWRPAYECLDFSDLGTSIFDRQKPLVPKTLRRILRGLKKFINQPTPLVMYCNSPGHCWPVTRPINTLTTVNNKALVTPLLMTYYSNGGCQTVDKPAPTLTTKDKVGLCWFSRQFGQGGGQCQPVNQPAGSITTTPKLDLCVAWLADMKFQNAGKPIDAPAPTLLTGDHQYLATAFIYNPQYNNTGNSLTAPAPTIVARQKSYPLSLCVTMPAGTPRWEPQDGDCPDMIALRNFMREHQVADIHMRMLSVYELKRLQGFPEDYVLIGTKAEQKKYIGNAVVPVVVSAWMRAVADAIREQETAATP